MIDRTNYYARLGLPINATPEEVRRAYRNAALKLHPDTNVEAGATEFFLQAHEAFEVLVNAERRAAYDSKLPSEAKTPPKVHISVVYSSPTLQNIQQMQFVYALVELQTREKVESQSAPPLNLSLVVDTSTSMQGEAMETVKSTALELIRQLRSQDRLSLVAFSDKATVLLPASSILDKKQAVDAVVRLKPHGATEIYQGLNAGLNEILLFRTSNQINHILLLTDGRTYGDEAHCFRLAEQAAENGIVISALGIGHKWNDAFLDTLTSRTGGNCLYVSRPQDIKHFLNEKIKILEKSYADRVIYDFKTGPGVSMVYAMRIFPDVCVLNPESPFQMGSIPEGSRLAVLLELQVEHMPEQTETVILTEGKINMEIPSRIVPKYSWVLRTERPVSSDPPSGSPPYPIMQAVSRMTLYRMQEKAQKEAAEGKISEATRRLQHLATHLLANGEAELASTVIKEVQVIEGKRGMSEQGKKDIKYGTRALMLPSSVSIPEEKDLNTGSKGGNE
jgi:Ca-activated chloride channel homolog